MNDSILRLFIDWNVPPLVTCALFLAAISYCVGWVRIRRTRPDQFPPWRLAAFLGGILMILVAVASPFDTFSESLLFMHMAQHFVLMSIAPPLIVFGAPVVPMLRALPRWFIRLLRPLFTTGMIHRAGQFLTRPRVAWLAMNAAYVGWHIPRAYEFALASENWHNFEHACFFFSNLMFWWPIIRQWPNAAPQLRWRLIPYLLLADVVNTGLSASLCFSGTLLYPSYGEILRPFGLSALHDQIAAGALMWVSGSVVFVLPAVVITLQLLVSADRSTAGRSQHDDSMQWETR
jgi:cytochrome c oxidase assembly factor CtaG